MDEKFSSSKFKQFEKEQMAIVSFVGFQSHLVVGFFKQAREVYPVHSGTIYLIHSKREDVSSDQYAKYSLVRAELDQELNESWDTFNVKEITLRNIWDIREIIENLNNIIEEKCLVNLSAGPSVFASSVVLWGMGRRSLLIGHIIERTEKSLKRLGEESNIYIFSFIDLKPYFFYVNLDHISKTILKAIASGSQISSSILTFVRKSYEEHDKISLRSIQMKLNNLEGLGIIKSYKAGKSKNYLISDDLAKIIDIFDFPRL